MFIEEFNQDLAVHDYFHQNSFKGIETEMYQLSRLFNYKDGINTTQLKLCIEKCNIEFDDEIQFYLTPDGTHLGNLWISINKVPIGKIFTNTPTPTCTTNGLGVDGIPDLEKTKQVLEFLVNDWSESEKTKTTLFEYLNKPIIKGLNNGLTLIEYFNDFNATDIDEFEFLVPSNFSLNGIELEIEKDFSLSALPIIYPTKTSIDFLETLKNTSSNFEDFILRIEEQWNINIFGTAIFNSNSKMYKELYYSEIKMEDVFKMIYRLHSIGLVDDYTIDYYLGIFTFKVVKKDKEYYIEQTNNHLLKYLSRAVTLKKIGELEEKTKSLDTFSTVKKCIRLILEFTYDDIVKKRKEAVNDLFKFISDGIELSKKEVNNTSFKSFWFNSHFKEEMFYYFNAKYARAGFKIGAEPYSLIDDTEMGRISNWETFEKFAKILNEQNRFISECKMMRGSCKRIWRSLAKDDSEKEYTLKILYAYATFGLNNKFYYKEAEESLFNGFSIYYNQIEDYILFKKRFSQMEALLLSSTTNQDFIPYLKNVRHKIMLMVNLSFASTIKSKIELV